MTSGGKKRKRADTSREGEEEIWNETPLCLLVFARPRGKSIEPMGQHWLRAPHCGRPRWLLWLPVGFLPSCLT